MWVLLATVLLLCCRGDDLATIDRLFASSYSSPAALEAAMPAEARRGSAAVFSALDRDGDGVVTRAEIAAAFPMSAASGELKQGHLSLGGRDSMWIMWVTDDKQSSPPWVRWGAAASRLGQNATGTSHTYNVGLFGWHKWLHQAGMTGLTAGQPVFYQFGNGALASEVQSFRMPGTGEARIAFLADQGTVEPLGNAVAQQMARDSLQQPFDAVHIAGDLAYAWKRSVLRSCLWCVF